MTLAPATGLGALLPDEPFLSSAILEWHPPLLGEVKLVTVLFFDIGVYLIVIGLVLGLLVVLGPTRPEDAADVAHAAGDAVDGTDRTDGRHTEVGR